MTAPGRQRAGRCGRMLAGLALGAAIVAVAPATAFGATADLSVDKTDSADPATEGVEFSYTAAVANAGPDDANGVELVDELPNKLEFISATASQGSCERQGKRVTCALGTIAADAAASVEIAVVPRADGPLVNSATVTTADEDPQPANNTDTEATTVVIAPAPPTCGGDEATIIGTDGDDEIVGTDKRDVIAALGGDDRVVALGGKDIVCGFGGNDRLKGRAAADVVRGGGGDDRLGGGGGPDLLRGGTGRDKCRGGPGSDTKRSC